ncbi:hypothetical protein ACFQDZ_01000 [Sulfitobacter pacificus]|uniref:hypothetical protein n=1 Tax=Sulfitobacter pacificus TaxID=1499314 RepID=UPI00361BA2B2
MIYGWLILGMGWGLLRAHHDGQWHDMRKPLAVSLLVGTVWLAVAVASPVWASLLIWVMLLAALAALFLAPVNDQTWAAWPVGLYAGWLSAASCVSLGLLTAGYGFWTKTPLRLFLQGLPSSSVALCKARWGVPRPMASR